MNWRRGLTRLYVVVWVLFAGGGIFFAIEGTNQALARRRGVIAFAKTYDGLLTLKEFQTLSDSNILNRLCPAPDTTTWEPKSFRPVGFSRAEDGTYAIPAAFFDTLSFSQSRSVMVPIGPISLVWLTWAAICLLAPALILVTTRWIISGFTT